MAAWQTVRIFGSWFWSSGDLRPGTYMITSNAQVTSDVGQGVVLPKGFVRSGQLNIDEANGLASFEYEAPAADDPDMFPSDFTITIRITPEGSKPIDYELSPSLAQQDTGLNLKNVIVPDAWPTVLPRIAGEPGGLAELDSQGRVINADGEVLGQVSMTPEQQQDLVDEVLEDLELPNQVLLWENAKA